MGTEDENRLERGYGTKDLSVTITARTLRLDFPQPVHCRKLHVCLFDATGRLVTMWNAGKLMEAGIALPLDGTALRTGAYLLRVSSGASTIVARNVLIVQ